MISIEIDILMKNLKYNQCEEILIYKKLGIVVKLKKTTR